MSFHPLDSPSRRSRFVSLAALVACMLATAVGAEAQTPTRTATPVPPGTPTPTPTSTPHLVSLTLAPATAKRNAGQSQNFTVSGALSDGNTKNMTQLVTYASSNPAVAQAPNEAGNKGKVNAVGPGEATIS